MCRAEAVLQAPPKKTRLPELNRFDLKDRGMIQTYIDTFKPLSCEYNFSNLFAWQDAYQLTWTLYQERLLIYDNVSQCGFIPLGEDFCPEELVVLSLNLKDMGLTPDFYLVTPDYLRRFPWIENYYEVREERDYSEYIYDVNSLCELTGKKLHKKRNLISQFKRAYPDFEVHPLKGEYKSKALELTKELMSRSKLNSKTLDHEFCALKTSFDYFEDLGLEGLAITIGSRMVAFSVFSRLSRSTYDIQFEKSDIEFKGVSQVINHETALYLKDKCFYLNREQDLGIKGLRQAKLSYQPLKLITLYSLVFSPLN
ncbi:DUF2156 domain-containing protein [Desulfobacula toluolica]|uniref:Conserved uncharacterized protein n=1 Tax=Desulfobacula toluolica (strain DSM 7467 / Tol2) TaxID=651182 RepID=K0NJN3_DESTT|nr:phosphatidylglycerol lysyltransferase domain-containing protein [Desulfobacula toluolica]CCK80078.1 conserved uncharacterized protein [Desulfobacula toluolica Tol2]